MGALYQFTCVSCGYSAEVSGGADAGMTSETQTVICFDCKELTDNLVVDERGHPVKLKCRKCFETNIQPWNNGDKCPRCHGEVKKGKLTLCWD